MTVTEQVITIAMCVLGTVLTRFLPFWVFSENRQTPAFIQYIGRYLPSAVFGMLVVYCLKDVDFLHGNHGAYEIIGIAVTVILHLWKRNFMLSMAVGTLCYMLLMQFAPF